MSVVNCCLSVTSTATNTSQESTNTSSSSSSPSSSSSQPSIPRPPINIALPQKKPLKSSTEPNDMPVKITSKLRRYYGGDKDPLDTDDYMWNKDFMGRMKKLIQDTKEEPTFVSEEEGASGFLSLNRVMSLDNMELDMSKELKPVSKVAAEQVEETNNDTAARKWRAAPTRREQEKWDRAAKAASGGTDVILKESKRFRGDPAILAAQSREQYMKLKDQLQLFTVGIGGIGLVSSYLSYSTEITVSYAAGFLGSLAYMRMLGSSIDSIADGARGAIKGAIGQPRILVPVVLVMVYNRWNAILVPDYGFIPLDLIPMLVGFFTYKIATFMQVVEEAVTAATVKTTQD